jgi:hypothetical protein
VPERAEQVFHLFLVPKTGVIRSERDFHAGNLLIETRDHCRGQLPTVQFCQLAPDLSFALG